MSVWATALQYAEVKFDAKKYPILIPTPVEDMYRTIINPHTSKVDQINWARGEKHNEEALRALQTITLGQETSPGTGGIRIGAIEPLQGNMQDGFHSMNRTAGEINDLIVDHLTTHHSMITHLAMGPKLFRKYRENTWTGPTTIGPWPTRVVQGVFPFPGIENITCVVDPVLGAMEPNTIYAIDKMNGALYGQGPMFSNQFNDTQRDAVISKTTEFYQYLMVDKSTIKVNNDVSYDRRFAFKINVPESS